MITAIIPTRGDPLLPDTVRSLGGYCDEIIIIDDASEVPVKQADFGAESGVQVVRNEARLGPGPCRDRGAKLARSPWLLFCDSHMSFPSNWHYLASQHLEGSDVSELWGAVWHRDVIDNSWWHDTRQVAGADSYFWRHDDKSRFSFMDLLPRRPKREVNYDVPCVLGGCYFMHEEWFSKIGGMAPLVGYGSEETWLSWSTWLLGGHVRIMGDLPVIHHHQTATRSRKPLIPEWEANRLVVLKRILTPDEFTAFCSWLPITDSVKHIVGSHNYFFDGLREQNVLSHHEVCEAFALQTVDEALELMEAFYLQEHKSNYERD